MAARWAATSPSGCTRMALTLARPDGARVPDAPAGARHRGRADDRGRRRGQPGHGGRAASASSGWISPGTRSTGAGSVRLVQGDLGTSWRTGKPVIGLILERLPVTLELTCWPSPSRSCWAFRPAWSPPCGATARSTTSRGWAPCWGSRSPSSGKGRCSSCSSRSTCAGCRPWCGSICGPIPGATSRSWLLPALCLGTASAANIARTTRACMLDVLRSEYIRTAAAKGLAERAVVLKHALRNALIPVVTVAGLQIGILLGGTVVVEEVFTLPGVGRLVLWSIYQRDYPLTQSTILFIAVMFMTINLAVDLLYSVPRSAHPLRDVRGGRTEGDRCAHRCCSSRARRSGWKSWSWKRRGRARSSCAWRRAACATAVCTRRTGLDGRSRSHRPR